LTLPDAVYIGPVRWRISDSQADWNTYAQAGGYRLGVDIVGATLNRQALILIDPHEDPQVQRVTLLHEILHAIAWTVGTYAMGEMSQERWTNTITPTLLDTIRCNAELFAWLVEI
jgi:hypothetical protein